MPATPADTRLAYIVSAARIDNALDVYFRHISNVLERPVLGNQRAIFVVIILRLAAAGQPLWATQTAVSTRCADRHVFGHTKTISSLSSLSLI